MMTISQNRAKPVQRRAGRWIGAALTALIALGSGPLGAEEERLPAPTVAEPALGEILRAAYGEKPAEYVPRTHLKTPDGRPRYVNRLILETSPYLVQHAHNPVDWRPWGPETLAAAKAADKPIFLSVGYATCHWCHVMEEESFDDEEVAAVLNADFIAVKVDREQRPDVDHAYMIATQMTTGRGGWPNSVFLTPDGAPFFAGTYFPRSHFLDVLSAVATAWRDQRPEIDAQAEQIAEAVAEFVGQSAAAAALEERAHQDAVAQLDRAFNELQGGFSSAAQFPQEPYLLFLLDRWRRAGDARALEIATVTLRAIEAGGIHDQIGGGFHRYTVDPNWRTPHFEKMLYNQGQLARVFVEGYEATAAPRFARAARRALDYVLRDMTAPDGAFYTAEDADSAGPPGTEAAGQRVEGAFYLWTPEELRAALPAADAERALTLFGVDQPATLEHGRVAHLEPDAGLDAAEADRLAEALRQARDARPRPLRDDKIIAGWNGLAIRAFAAAGVALDEPRYLEAAARAGDTIWTRLWAEGRLRRLYAGGETAPLEGGLSDYAWLGLAYVALWDATAQPRWRDRALALADRLTEKFAHPSGRLKMAAEDGPMGPMFEGEDLATPAGESSALELYVALAARSQDLKNAQRATALLAAISGAMAADPAARTTALTAAEALRAGESRLERALSKGVVHALARRDGDELTITLRIAEGWHINADQPLQEDLIATALTGPALSAPRYPPALVRELGFQDAPLALLEGTVEISARIADPSAIETTLRVQACSDRVCLEPEEADFRLPPAAPR